MSHPHPYDVELGERMRKARRAADITQEKVGEQLDPVRGASAVAKMERGDSRQKAADVAKWAVICGTTPDELHGWE